jgi:cell shape-determining protein MreC
VENKKINVTFYLVVIVFLAFIIILVRDFRAQRINDLREYASKITNVVNRDNYRIRMLANQLMMERKENEDLKNTLTETRNALEGISKKLIQPGPVAPANAPAVPATATK